MTITEQNRYLAVPVRRNAEETKIYFYKGSDLLRDVAARVDFLNPDYVAFYDLKSFFHMDLTILCDAGAYVLSV